jgi:hypothetical protein
MLLPLAAICINIRTVNFKKYLYHLMRGCNVDQYFLNASIFIKSKHCNQRPDSLQSESRTLVNENPGIESSSFASYSRMESTANVRESDAHTRNMYQSEFKKLRNDMKRIQENYDMML